MKSIHTLLLFHSPHVSSLHLLLSVAPSSLILGNRLLRLRVVAHIVIVIVPLFIILIFIIAVVAVFVKIAALVWRRFDVASLRLPSMLTSKRGEKKSQRQSDTGEYSSSAEMRAHLGGLSV